MLFALLNLFILRAKSGLIILTNEEIHMKLRPLGDRIIVSRAEEETKTAGGIVIPDSASKEKPIRGKVISVGPGKTLDNGTVRAIDVKVGDEILFGKYAGTEVKIDGEELVVMREDDVMAVVTA
jgi:chaperonin GroES